MADTFDKKTRSRIMSSIKSVNTSLEISFRKHLSKSKVKGYRIHYKILGKPDIAFPSKKIAVFIDGDFWHGYNWKKLHKSLPKKYWQKKIKKNIMRDIEYTKRLKKEGWKVLRLWEHEIKSNPGKCVKKVVAVLKSHKGLRKNYGK